MTRFRPLALVAALALLASMSTATAAQAKTTISMSGSTSIAPLAARLATAFKNQRQFRGKVRFTLAQGGSDVGITDVSRKRVSIGNSSRDPKRADPKGIVFNKIARDAVCIVTNRRNPIGNLSQGQIQDIFSGRIRSWSRVPGAKVSGAIDLVTRTQASGTQDAFQNIFLGKRLRVAGSATTKSSNGLQAQAIKSNPNAIGYASFNFVNGTHNVPYRGTRCSLRNAKAGTYGGARNFFMVTRGKPRGGVKSFIRFIRTNSAAKRVISTNWVPLR